MEKIALITGASKGIGKEFAKVFAKNGYSLILIARTVSELENLQREVKQLYGCESKVLSVDLSQPDCVETIMNTFASDMPNVEVLINNAGFGIAKKLHDIPYEDINGMLAININALTKLTYKVIPFMLRTQRGKILNVSSTAAYSPGPYMAIYYASKAYVSSFSEAIYEEFKKDGIHVATLCPGVTHTSFQSRAGMEKSPLVSGFIPGMTPEKVATIAYAGLMKHKRVIIPGLFNKIAALMMCLTPNFINAKLTALLDKPKID